MSLCFYSFEESQVFFFFGLTKLLIILIHSFRTKCFYSMLALHLREPHKRLLFQVSSDIIQITYSPKGLFM